MKLTIVTAAGPLEVKASHSDFVARVKAEFLRKLGMPEVGPVALRFGDMVLEDDVTLGSVGITDGSELHQVAASHTTSHGHRDYASYSAELERARDRRKSEEDGGAGGSGGGGGGGRSSGGPWDATWVHGEEWRTFPPVLIRDEEGAMTALESTSSSSSSTPSTALTSRYGGVLSRPIQRFSPGSTMGRGGSVGRVLKRVYLCEARGHTFKLLHQLEGRWHGDCEGMSVPMVVSTDLAFDQAARQWRERQRFVEEDGLSREQIYVFIPTGDGMCRVERPDGTPARMGAQVTLKEVTENVILVTARSLTTGKPLVVETIVMVDSTRRTRTIQRFDASGRAAKPVHIRETRVFDSVAGAVTPYQADIAAEAEERAGPGQGFGGPRMPSSPLMTPTEPPTDAVPGFSASGE